ncbi:hypothetical protein [Actinophytocola sp.]|uniref:hypothetical protein n=1 Tax=Actinophytocola sp. TaxID=1872138 RepID=UPI002D804634|nr:hypothetical protein [Actinophytocola sp.]HET9137727.1 hypothetical protein [Actinophytocola sp.]
MTNCRTLPGIFRPLAHQVPDNARAVPLDGYYARQLGLTGRWTFFALCGAPCWPHPLGSAALTPCPRCWSTTLVVDLPDPGPQLARSA